MWQGQMLVPGMSEQTAVKIPSTGLCVGLDESDTLFPRDGSSCSAAEGWLRLGENGGGLLSLGMDLLPHTQPAQGDAGVTVSASPGGMHTLIRAARRRRLGLLTELEVRSKVLDRQDVLPGRVRGRWWLPVKLWMVSGGEEGVLWQKWQCAVKSVFLLNSRFSSPAELRRLVSRFVLFVWVFMYVLFSAAWTMQSLLNSASVQWIHNSNGCQQSYFCGKLILHEAGLSCSEGVEVDWKHKSELKAEIASSTGDNYKRSAE